VLDHLAKPFLAHGLKSRMSEPQQFIIKINRLSMEIIHTRRKKNGNKERKPVLWQMKKLVAVGPWPCSASLTAGLARCVFRVRVFDHPDLVPGDSAEHKAR
jgi:hypothetical protein